MCSPRMIRRLWSEIEASEGLQFLMRGIWTQGTIRMNSSSFSGLHTGFRRISGPGKSHGPERRIGGRCFWNAYGQKMGLPDER